MQHVDEPILKTFHLDQGHQNSQKNYNVGVGKVYSNLKPFGPISCYRGLNDILKTQEMCRQTKMGDKVS